MCSSHPLLSTPTARPAGALPSPTWATAQPPLELWPPIGTSSCTPVDEGRPLHPALTCLCPPPNSKHCPGSPVPSGQSQDCQLCSPAQPHHCHLLSSSSSLPPLPVPSIHLPSPSTAPHVLGAGFWGPNPAAVSPSLLYAVLPQIMVETCDIKVTIYFLHNNALLAKSLSTSFLSMPPLFDCFVSPESRSVPGTEQRPEKPSLTI